jgi:hypothetical protein
MEAPEKLSGVVLKESQQGSQQAGQTHRARGPGRPGHSPWPASLARGLPLTVKGSACRPGTWWRGTRRRPGGGKLYDILLFGLCNSLLYYPPCNNLDRMCQNVLK